MQPLCINKWKQPKFIHINETFNDQIQVTASKSIQYIKLTTHCTASRVLQGASLRCVLLSQNTTQSRKSNAVQLVANSLQTIPLGWPLAAASLRCSTPPCCEP